MNWVWSLYLNLPDDANNHYAVPLSAKDVSGLAPAIIMTAEYDVLRDDGIGYARRLREAGNQVIDKDFAGMIHGIFSYGTYVDETVRLREWISASIDSILAR